MSEKKVFSVSIIGCGSRGCDAYAVRMASKKDKFKLVALCDIRAERLRWCGREFNIKSDKLFTDEAEFFKEKRSDVLVIATQDRDHVRMCVRALELGYEVLLEKPISPKLEELKALEIAQKKYKHNVVVCHVLRYAPAFVMVKRLLEGGAIGNLVRINALEKVGYWHFAHSFVRGNWRNSNQTSPSILAKCCHDLDLLQYYAGGKCRNVYSTGSLSFFKKENKPPQATSRCENCPLIATCPYSAENIYITRWKQEGSPEYEWPYNIIAPKPNTEENIRKGYLESDYGRCVFECDNNVVDNQSITATFENGVVATLTMTAFTEECSRKLTFYGTYGEIVLNEDSDALTVKAFGKEPKVYKISEICKNEVNDTVGHGGGDMGLVETFYKILCGEGTVETSLERSIESHKMAFSAELSRLQGEVVIL